MSLSMWILFILWYIVSFYMLGWTVFFVDRMMQAVVRLLHRF
jgi:hypothetical protein